MNRIKQIAPVWITLVMALGMSGCNSSSSSDSQTADLDQLAARLEQSKEPVVEQPPVEAAADEPAETVVEEPQVVTETTPKRGQSFYGQGGYLNAVFGAHFRSANKIVLRQIENNEKIFEGNHGRKPESHEEYMKEIIEEGGIELPELEEGYEYWYDVSDHELKQRRPVDQAPANAE
jgi:hypothetical protein